MITYTVEFNYLPIYHRNSTRQHVYNNQEESCTSWTSQSLTECSYIMIILNELCSIYIVTYVYRTLNVIRIYTSVHC